MPPKKKKQPRSTGIIPTTEAQLLTQIAATGDLLAARRAGITANTFASPTSQLVYEFIEEHYRNPGTPKEVPTVEQLTHHYRAFEPTASDASVGSLSDELKHHRFKSELVTELGEVFETAKLKPAEAAARGISSIRKLIQLYGDSADTTMSESAIELVHKLEEIKSMRGVTGIPYPWATLNRETGGLNPGDLAVIYARPKNFKTWLAIDAAVQATYKYNHRVLFVTTEMTLEQIKKRVLATLSDVDYERMRTGAMSKGELARIHDMADMLAADEDESRFTISSFAKGEKGIGHLEAKIEEYEPDLVIVDGLYRLHDDVTRSRSRDQLVVSNIVMGAKNCALQYKIPMLVTTQANREGEQTKGTTLREMAFSDSFAQEVDLALRVMFEPETGVITAVIAGIREGKTATFYIEPKPGNSFHEVDGQHAMAAQRASRKAPAPKRRPQPAREYTNKRKM